MCTEYNHLWSFGGIVDEVGAVGDWTVEADVAYLGYQTAGVEINIRHSTISKEYKILTKMNFASNLLEGIKDENSSLQQTDLIFNKSSFMFWFSFIETILILNYCINIAKGTTDPGVDCL